MHELLSKVGRWWVRGWRGPGFVLGCLLPPALAAAESSPAVTNPRFTGAPFLRTWSSEEYDAAPVNWHILQHPGNGFVYVGNNYGALEYDGATWRLYPLAGEGPVRSLAIDASGSVWLGGVGVVAKLVPDARGVLQVVDVTAKIPTAGRDLGDFNYALAAPDGVYFSTVRDLVRFAADGTIQRWSIPGRTNGLFWHDGALHLTSDPDGLLKLSHDQIVSAAPAPAVSGGAGKVSRRVLAARPKGAEGTLLLTSRGPMLWRGAQTPLTPLSPSSPAFFAEAAATAAAFLADGRLAFSFLRQGLLILDAQGETAVRFDQSHGLPSNRIEEMATDLEGGLWVAQRTGLARLQIDSRFAQHGPALGLSGSPRALFRFGDRLYVTHNEGLAWRDDVTGHFQSVSGLTAGLNTLVEAGGRLYGTGSRLYEITRDDRVRTVLSLSLTSLHRLRQSPGYYLGGSPSGAWLLRLEGENWQNVGALANVTGGLTRFRDDGDGMIWAVGYDGHGAWRIDFRGGPRPDAPAQRYDESRGLPYVRRRDSARFVVRDADLLLTCAMWTRRFDRAADRFVPVADREGLSGDTGAVAASTDSRGTNWWFVVQPSPRIVRLAADSQPPWRPEEIPSGPLRSIVPNSIYFDDPTRTLWVAGQGSLVSLDPSWHSPRPRPALRTFIRSVSTAKGDILFGESGHGTPPVRRLALPSTQSTLRFTFAAPAFEGDYHGKVTTHYRSRLRGFEEEWSAWSTATTREFTNLPHRDFSLEVQARALDGRESPVTTLALAIAPPWWVTRWAFLAYAVATFGALAAFVRTRTRLLLRRAAQLETVVAQRTAELARLRQIDRDESIAARLAEEKTRLEMLRYQLNPHFLYNALNSIRALIFSNPPAAGDMVLQFAELCRVTLTRPEETAPVSEEFAMLRLYLDMEKTRWRDKLMIEIDLAPDAAAQPIPPFLLLPLVENALKHGWQPATRTLRLRLSARMAGPASLLLEVANSGVWLERGQSAAPSTGIGLENLRQRLQRYYPSRHAFTTTEREGWVIAHLALALGASQKSPAENA